MSSTVLDQFRHEFRRHKDLADKAIAGLDEDAFTQRLAEQVNPVALIVKHLAGNLQSRWSDFLTSDGEKPTRQRDREFEIESGDSRATLLAAWERGWRTLFETLGTLNDIDLEKTVMIRQEPHTVLQALLRGVTHVAYHIGQIMYLARLFRPQTPWLTIAPGKSASHVGGYFKK